MEEDIDNILNTLVNDLFKADTDIRLGKKPANSGISTSRKLHDNAIQRLLALIHTREQQARIDEVNKIPYWGTPYDTDVFGYEKLFRDNRLSQLTKQEEQ